MAQPYASYVTDTAGNMRATDFILLEHAGTDLEPLLTHLGFHFDLLIANTSDRARDWRLFFTDADAALIGQLCAADIARSGITTSIRRCGFLKRSSSAKAFSVKCGLKNILKSPPCARRARKPKALVASVSSRGKRPSARGCSKSAAYRTLTGPRRTHLYGDVSALTVPFLSDAAGSLNVATCMSDRTKVDPNAASPHQN
jgi:hypothetical protein